MMVKYKEASSRLHWFHLCHIRLVAQLIFEVSMGHMGQLLEWELKQMYS